MHPLGVTGESQGSVQSLDNGNFLVGFGHAPVATEFSPDGVVVCDLGFGPLRISNPDQRLACGIRESYRVSKMRWEATPHYDPSVFVDLQRGDVFVSWNGATNVKTWQLELVAKRGEWFGASSIPKTGFETNFTIPMGYRENMRLFAIDKSDKTIGRWLVNSRGLVQAEVCQLNN